MYFGNCIILYLTQHYKRHKVLAARPGSQFVDKVDRQNPTTSLISMAKGRKSKKKERFYQVEVITAARVADDDEPGWEYLVEWYGYNEDENSWEPEYNLQNGCEKLLASFWNDVGFDNKDYQVGHVVQARKSWIEKERKRFLLEYGKEDREEKEKKKSKDKSKGKAKAKGKEKEKIDVKQEENDDELVEKIRDSKKRKQLPSRDISESSARNSRERIASQGKSPVDSSGDDDTPLKINAPSLQQKAKRKRVVVSSDEENPNRSKKIQKMDESLSKANEIAKDQSTPPPESRMSVSPPSSPEVSLQTTIQAKAVSIEAPALKHTRRVTNPQAKIATLSASEIPSSSGGISTKHRLGQGALAPTLPKNIVPLIPQKSHPHPIRPSGSSLMNLNFKKNTVPTPVLGPRSPMTSDPTLASLNSPTVGSPQMLTDAFPPVLRQNTAPSIIEPQYQKNQPSIQPDPAPPPPISPPARSEADDFLQSIMPPSLAGPLLPAPEESSGPVPPKSLHSGKASLPLPLPRRIPKVWKWVGPLYLNSNVEPLCNTKIDKVSKPPASALKFSFSFDNIEKIRVNCLYDNADFFLNLGVFTVPPQIGIFGPEEEKDTRPFSVFADYLERAKKVFLMPVELDNRIVAYALFFPYAHRMKVIGMDVPGDFNQPGSLVAALIPFTLLPDQIMKIPPFPSIPPRSTEKVLVRNSLESHLRLQVLGFPAPLFKYIQDGRSKRSVTIFTGIDSEKIDLDTQNLVTHIFHRENTPLVAPNSEARMVFIHARAFNHLHQFPRLAERRATSTVQFYVYGTHPDHSPSLGPVQEVYPCGGIVTFSPFAMRKNPLGVQELMRKINAHPLWASYILPSSLGLLAKLECGVNDPMAVFDKQRLMMDIFLEQISEGKTALIEAPPENIKDSHQEGVIKAWLSRFLLFEPLKKRDALSAGIMAFLSNPELSRSEAWQSKALINRDIASDLNRMQKQPVFMTRYRRYVVIDIDSPDTPGPGQCDYGLEWSSLSKFDFKDDFFPKQQ